MFRSISYYIVCSGIKAVGFTFGWVLVPIMFLTRNRPAFLWKLWYNPEDGLDVPNWYMPGYWRWFRLYWYHCWRNNANGMRNWRWISPLPDPSRVRFIGHKQGANPPPRTAKGWVWFLAWQDHYWGFFATRWVDVPLRGRCWVDFRVGWKVDPLDAEGQVGGKAKYGIGFTPLSPTIHRAKAK